ncbi:MAG: hypothetical protein Q8O67_19155 [Deltaproteobacteria bacterium]|nr:hypothetical protein [Deltaproteobacteria bacterium]
MLLRAVPVSILLVLFDAACVFDGDPAGAVVLCVDDDDCAAPFTCDPGSHLCVGAGAPQLIVAAFEDDVTNAEVIRLSVQADVPLSTSEPVVVEMGQPALAFALVESTGTQQVLLASLVDAPVGRFTITGFVLTSVDGAHTRVPSEGPSFVLDRTPPVLFDVRASTSIVADVAPDNVYEVCATANEPTVAAESAVIVGGAQGACVDVDAAGRLCCSVVIGAGTSDGLVVPRLGVRDRAGNLAEVAAPTLDVDTLPPAVVEGTVGVDVSIGGRSVDVVSGNATAVIAFVVDEDLQGDPLVSLDAGGAPLPLLVERRGRAISARVVDAGVVVPGTYVVRAELVDVFGHGASVELPLPAPHAGGLVFANDDPICPAPGTSFACVDLDGDGGLARSGSCPGGDDDDDRDPAREATANDLPGDGIDQNFDGADAVVDETWTFVDSEDGVDVAGGGGAAAPLRSIREAVIECARRVSLGGSCPGLLLALRPAPYALVSVDGAVAVLSGGRDPITWSATGERSRMSSGGADWRGGLIDHVDVDGDLLVDRGVLLDSLVTDLSCSDSQLMRVRVGDLGASGACVIFDSVVETTQIGSFSSVALLRSRTGGISLGTNSSLSAVSSVLVGNNATPPMRSEIASPFNRITLLGSTVVADATAPSAFQGNNGGEINIVGSIVVSASSGAPLIDMSPTSVSISDSVLFSPSVTLVRRQGATTESPTSFATLQACGLDGCPASADFAGAFSSRRIDARDPEVGADGTLAADSVARGKLGASLFENPGLPSSLLVNLAGACRFDDDGTADPGALRP